MKAIPLTAAMALLLAAGAGPANAVEPAGHAPISPVGQCMRAGQARDWGVVDARRVVVKTWDGRYYDINLKDNCPAMAKKAYLTLSEGRMVRDGRICGEIGESVLAHGGQANRLHDRPCRIDSLRRMDKQEFEAFFEPAPTVASRLTAASAAAGASSSGGSADRGRSPAGSCRG